MRPSTDQKTSPNERNPRPQEASRRRSSEGAAVGIPYREPSTFAPGFVLQDRFRILRFLARGGAGEVYEAFDTELRCPVALKLVRPEVAANESAIERFRREIALARQVTHPNVSRIFDVFRVELPPRRPGERPASSLFLSMELLVGESLAGRLRRLGPLNQSQALPLVIDMVEGLKAAHRAGVIHRDLKSANVMLARSGDEVRAVIMDFGLALDQAHDPNDPDPLTNSGVVVGTPNYMSPEQLTGGEITPAVDQYSLGIVLFEMLTGQRPFRGENEVSTAVKRLTEAPPSPRSIVPELDVHWERTILRMLEVEPEQRFPRLDDIVYRLVGTTMPVTIPVGKPASKRVRPSLWVIAGGLVLVALALSQAEPDLSRRMFEPKSLAAAMIADHGSAPLTIGSLQPEVVPPAYYWMTTALSGLLAHELHGDGIDVSWVPATAADSNDPLIQRTRYNAPLFVGGSYRLDPALEQVTLDLTFVDDSNQQRLRIQGSANDLAAVAREAAREIRRAAGLPAVQREPLSAATLRRVAERELISGRDLSALRLLEEGQALDASKPEARRDSTLLAELGLILQQTGSHEAAAKTVQQALAAAGSNTKERLLAEASVAWVLGDLRTAEERFTALLGLDAEEPQNFLRLSAVLLEIGKPDEALSVLDRLSQLDHPASLTEKVLRARAQNDRGAFLAAIENAQEAIEIGHSNAADWPLGEALLQQGRAYIGREQPDLGINSLHEADRWLKEAGGRPIRLRVLQELIAAEEARNNTAAASSLKQQLDDLRTRV